MKTRGSQAIARDKRGEGSPMGWIHAGEFHPHGRGR